MVLSLELIIANDFIISLVIVKIKYLTIFTFSFKTLVTITVVCYCILSLSVAEIRHVEPVRRDKGYLIHVGGLCPSVSEVCQDVYFELHF